MPELYPDMINFCMKESIFNHFELPVIVICCFGTQSIGKSTFLNELTGSLFDVSGMRCTEGIWMTVKLFMHSKKGKGKKCTSKCQICENNNCYLFSHNTSDTKIKCICENCMCGKKCFFSKENNKLINCDLKCSLEKGHENLLKCCYKNCNCNCKCQCICKGNNHDHICARCKIKEECNCECNCKHLCKYPALLHNFICVCLDFEGLGTFERSSEQDIQMALIGSAMGNNIIFRTNNTYDRFIEETLEKLSLGSQRNNTKVEHLFGGSLIFSPRDVNQANKGQLRDEFQSKIKNSVKNWLKINNKNLKYHIFGLFDDYVFAPTPSFFDQSFYDTLRDIFTIDLIGNTLKYQRHPIYETGKEFCDYLREYLSIIYSGDFDFLSNRKEKKIRNYIENNVNKAYEVIGEYDNKQEFQDYFNDFNGLRIYFNKEYLSQLEIDFKHNKKYEADNTLIINNLQYFDKIPIGKYNLDEYGLIINLNKNNDNSFSMSIENFDDFGLILMIPEKFQKKENNENNENNKNNITYDDICSDLFKLWNKICEKMQFKERDKIITIFKLFTKTLIERRYNNVSKWIEKITENYENLKSLKKMDTSLKNKWKMCQTKCNECFYKCYKLDDHESKHSCSYDPEFNHKCKENCSFCIEFNCKDLNCEKTCDEKSGHSGIHTCKHGHKCNKKCDFKDYTIGCLVDCKLDAPHDGKNHNCGQEPHHCNEDCIYKDKARNCDNKCKLEYPHIPYVHNCKKTHLCKEYCDLKGKAKVEGYNDEEYKEFCSLVYGHKGNHNCGNKHICKEICSKNCKNKCQLLYGHTPEIHDCGAETHLCEKKCHFLSISRNCHEACRREFGHDGDCICDLQKQEHICNKKCNMPNCNNRDCVLKIGHQEGKCACDTCKCQQICHYRNCNQRCQYKACHTGEHLCSANEHLCKENCIFIGNSRTCNNYCSKILEREPNHSIHICGEIHKCKETCFLFGLTLNCNEKCCLEVTENGRHKNNEINHLCDEKNNHRCNQPCKLNKPAIRNCNILCDKLVNENNFDTNRKTHLGDHLCNSSNHLCNKDCNTFYKAPQIICNEKCSLDPDHNGPCKCKGNHICHSNCAYYPDSRGCNIYCTLPLEHSQLNHNCGLTLEQHKCNKKCPYCEEKCSLRYRHPETECVFLTKHQCENPCYASDNKCKGRCFKAKGHIDNIHLCELPENEHSCQEKCQLCSKKCGHAFGHQNKNNIICNKCGKANCKLVENVNRIGRVHLCGEKHICNQDCEIKGFCEITTPTVKEDIYDQNWRKISFQLFTKQKKNKLKCKEEIPEFELEHASGHHCSNEEHKCGFECKQCGHFCSLVYNHSSLLHICNHGNIMNSRIYISDSSEAKVKKNSIIYTFKNNEDANIFTCDEYCREQDQGHTHLLSEIPIIDNENVKEYNKNNDHYYECKCSYFWNKFLEFSGNTNEEKSSKCNCYCDGKHEDEKNEKGEKVYCGLPLWHKSEEHVFKCNHSNGIYTIFLVDQSGSMGNGSITPNRKDLQNENMIGAAIEAILNYCEERAGKNPKEKCALISYDSNASVVFEDIPIKEIDTIKNECIANLKPKGGTEFLYAFQKAKTIIDNAKNYKGYIPRIILLTDGLDFHHVETINYIGNDVSYI